MIRPVLSEHFQNREPSVIRTAQIEFMRRGGETRAVNVAIGNVSLPMHPTMVRRLKDLGAPGSPFRDGAVMAQLGAPDMRVPLLYALAGERHIDLETERTPFSGGSGTLPEHPELDRQALATATVSFVITGLVGAYFLAVRAGVRYQIGF